MTRWLLVFALFAKSLAVHGQDDFFVLGQSDAIVYDVELVPEKKYLIASIGDIVQVWNHESRELINTWNSSKIIALNVKGLMVAGVSKSGELSIWDLDAGSLTQHLKVCDAPLVSVVWIDSVFVVVGSDSGDLVKINTITKEIVSHIKQDAITALASQGDVLIVGDATGSLKVYDVEQMRLLSSAIAHGSWIREIKFSEIGANFVTVSDDGYYKIWEFKHQGVSLSSELKLGNWILCTDFIRSEETQYNVIVTGKRSGEIKLSTRFGTYTKRTNSIVNSVNIIRNELPLLVLAVATHGNGIQVISAKSMRIRP